MSWWGQLAGPPNLFEGRVCPGVNCDRRGHLQDWTQFVYWGALITNTTFRSVTTCAHCRHRLAIRTEYERVIQLPQAATLRPPRGPGTALPPVLQPGTPPTVAATTPVDLAFQAVQFPQAALPLAPPAGPPAQPGVPPPYIFQAGSNPALPGGPHAPHTGQPHVGQPPASQAGQPSAHLASATPSLYGNPYAPRVGLPVSQAGQPSVVSQPPAPQTGHPSAPAVPPPALQASTTTSRYGNPYGPPTFPASAAPSPYGSPYGPAMMSGGAPPSLYGNPYAAPTRSSSDRSAPPAVHRPSFLADPDRPSQHESPSSEAVAEPAELESSSHAGQEDSGHLRRGNRRVTDPEWPSGYPAIAVRTVVPPEDPQVDYLPLVGGHHYMIDSRQFNGYVAVLDMRGNRGWAPWDAFDVGEVASCREEVISNVKALRRRPITITIVEDAKNGNILARAVLGLSHALYARRDEFSNYNPGLNLNFDTEQKRIGNAQIFYDGVKAVPADPDRHPIKTLYECLSETGYNIDSFRQSRTVQYSDSPQKIVFYMWIHSEFFRKDGQYDTQETDYDRELERDELERDDLEVEDGLEQDVPEQDVPEQSESLDPGTNLSRELDPNRQPESYAGKTTLVGRRKREHDNMKLSTKPTKNVNYRAARQARVSLMYHVCEVDPEYADLSWFFEQMVCLLFETSCRELRELSSGASEERLQERDDANALLRIAQDVFLATGWPGGCISNPDFGSSLGKNWANPVIDASYSKLTWTKSYINEGNEIFRRTPKALPESGFLCKVGTCVFTCPPGQISEGTQVHVVFEFTAGGLSRHPYAWAAAVLPSLFGVTDITKALSWAVRVEWSEDGTDQVAYLQRDSSHKIRGRFEQCGFSEYRSASLVYSFFHQTIPTFDPEATGLGFLSSIFFPTADLVLETFDYKDRVKTFEPLNNVQFLDVDHSPRLLTEQEKRERYEQAFAEIPYAQIGGLPPEWQRVCDHCKWSYRPCVRQVDEAGNTTAEPCVNCEEKNMLCSYSIPISHDDLTPRGHHPFAEVDKDNFYGGELPSQGVKVINVE